MCVVFIASFLFSPILGDPFLAAGVYLVIFGVAIGVVIAGLVRLRRHPANAVVTLAVMMLFAVLVRADHTQWYLKGRELRLSMAADGLEAEARDVVANPPEPGQPHGHRIFFPAKSGSGGVVGWIWTEGIPAKAWGVAYDPAGLGRAGVRDAGEYSYGGYPCQPIDGPWYWCRFT